MFLKVLVGTTRTMELCWNRWMKIKFGFDHMKFEMPVKYLNEMLGRQLYIQVWSLGEKCKFESH